MIMITLKGLTIVAATLAGGMSSAVAQSILPWEDVVASGVFIARPGFGVPPGYVVVPPGYAVALAYFAPPGCNPSWYVGGYRRTCWRKIIHTTNGY
jgi:hypothetical protein